MPMYRANAAISCYRLKTLEVQPEPVSIGPVLAAVRQVDSAAVQPLQGFEHRAVMLHKEPLGYVQ